MIRLRAGIHIPIGDSTLSEVIRPSILEQRSPLSSLTIDTSDVDLYVVRSISFRLNMDPGGHSASPQILDQAVSREQGVSYYLHHPQLKCHSQVSMKGT